MGNRNFENYLYQSLGEEVNPKRLEVTIKYCNASDQCAIKKCKQTKTKEIYLCHAGLIDIIVPLFYNDVYLGSLTFGQMRKNNDFSDVYKRISKYTLDFKELERCFYKLPNYDKDKIESISNIAGDCKLFCVN